MTCLRRLLQTLCARFTRHRAMALEEVRIESERVLMVSRCHWCGYEDVDGWLRKARR